MTTAIVGGTTTTKGIGQFWHSSIETVRNVFTIAGQEYEFVDFWPNSKAIRAWHKKNDLGCYEWKLKFLPLSQIAVSTLKELPVWTSLSEDDQNKLINGTAAAEMEQVEQIFLNNKEKLSRKGRKGKPEYAGIPRELTCTKCSSPESPTIQKISPAIIIKQAASKGLTIQEYISTWACSCCEPRRRGKPANEKYINMAKMLTCHHPECTVKLVQHPSQTEKQANQAGKTYEEFVASWLCREHRPEGSKRGRKANANSPWKDKAKELVCACGIKQAQHPSQTYKQATAHGKTYEEYVAGWQCKACRPARSYNFTKETVKGFRKARENKNPEFDGIPKETSCKVCMKVVKLVPQNIVDKAKILGISVKELIDGYKCRSCGGRLSKKSKKQ